MKKHDSHQRRSTIVWAFRNLHHTGVMWSVRHKGLTIMHTPEIILKNCTFPIWKSGQAKVRNTGQKNVHAFVKGEMIVEPTEIYQLYKKLKKSKNYAYYNPFKNDTFIQSDGNELITANYVLLSNNKNSPLVAFI